MIVLDASAVVALLRGTPPAQAAALRERITRPAETLHAPQLLDLEVASVLRRAVGEGAVTPGRALDALQAHADAPLTRYPHWPLIRRVWELRNNLTPYDAAYVALAEALGAPLLTLDARIARSSEHRARVETL